MTQKRLRISALRRHDGDLGSQVPQTNKTRVLLSSYICTNALITPSENNNLNIIRNKPYVVNNNKSTDGIRYDNQFA